MNVKNTFPCIEMGKRPLFDFSSFDDTIKYASKLIDSFSKEFSIKEDIIMNIYIIGDINCEKELSDFVKTLADTSSGNLTFSAYGNTVKGEKIPTDEEKMKKDISNIRQASLILAVKGCGNFDALVKYRIEVAKLAGVPVIEIPNIWEKVEVL